MQLESDEAMASERRAKSDMEHEALARLEAIERANSAQTAEKEAREARASAEMLAESLRIQVCTRVAAFSRYTTKTRGSGVGEGRYGLTFRACEGTPHCREPSPRRNSGRKTYRYRLGKSVKTRRLTNLACSWTLPALGGFLRTHRIRCRNRSVLFTWYHPSTHKKS